MGLGPFRRRKLSLSTIKPQKANFGAELQVIYDLRGARRGSNPQPPHPLNSVFLVSLTSLLIPIFMGVSCQLDVNSHL
jgi:hypothetical protein